MLQFRIKKHASLFCAVSKLMKYCSPRTDFLISQMTRIALLLHLSEAAIMNLTRENTHD